MATITDKDGNKKISRYSKDTLQKRATADAALATAMPKVALARKGALALRGALAKPKGSK